VTNDPLLARPVTPGNLGMVQITGFRGNRPTVPVCQPRWHGTEGPT